MQRENGFTLITLMLLLGLATFASLVAFKIIPTYINYYTLTHSLENLLKDTELQSNDALRTSFAKRLNVNFIQDIKAHDLEIEKEGGMLILSVPISAKEHLVGGISICIDLVATASAPLKQ